MTDEQEKPFVLGELDRIADRVQRRFEEGRRLLSFQEYLRLFGADPVRHGRDASRYLRDLFEHYGTKTVRHAWGETRRFNLFDLPFEDAETSRAAHLVGHEELQNELYRAVSNFAQEGRANRLLLMHGPNGSAKSTAAACMMRALEDYSHSEEGALYRFHWVFPSRKTVRGAIGFGGDRAPKASGTESYALLSDDEIDARLVMEVRDHPLFLLPLPERRELLRRLHEQSGAEEPPCEWLWSGALSHKNKQVFESLLTDAGGSLAEVLRHVQVERYFISRRYRTGAVTVGPQLSVDAGERQITADRSLAALPTALQASTLFEAFGELVEAAGGLLEFSDLLKRPLDAFRYLQLTLETGIVPLNNQNLQTNCVMVGSANEIHLAAFREHPEYASFRGRLELIRVPYLRSYADEQAIYDRQIAPYLEVHVAPHATRLAAQFAVLTRLMRPHKDAYDDDVADAISSLTVFEKLELLNSGVTPERLDADMQKRLKARIAKVYEEFDAASDYEGRVGASPRVMRTLLMDAAQHPDYGYLSPFGVLSELDELCRKESEFDWLQAKKESGDFHDHKAMREWLRKQLLDALEEDIRTASGFVDETRYGELFERYVTHVSAYVKDEKIRNAVTGSFEAADERMMKEIEGYLGVTEGHDEHRKGLIANIAAYAIDNPGAPIDHEIVSPKLLQKLRDSVFQERRLPVGQLVRDLVTMLRGRKEQREAGPEGRDDKKEAASDDLAHERRAEAEAALERLGKLGYNEASALDAAMALLRSRFEEGAS